MNGSKWKTWFQFQMFAVAALAKLFLLKNHQHLTSRREIWNLHIHFATRKLHETTGKSLTNKYKPFRFLWFFSAKKEFNLNMTARPETLYSHDSLWNAFTILHSKARPQEFQHQNLVLLQKVRPWNSLSQRRFFLVLHTDSSRIPDALLCQSCYGFGFAPPIYVYLDIKMHFMRTVKIKEKWFTIESLVSWKSMHGTTAL